MKTEVEYKVNYVAMPTEAVRGCVFKENDREYTIYINTNINRLKQCRAIGHELAHIALRHHEAPEFSAAMEEDADRLAWAQYKEHLCGIL